MAKLFILAGAIGFLVAIGPPHHLRPFQASLGGVYAEWEQASANADTAWHNYLAVRRLAAEGSE